MILDGKDLIICAENCPCHNGALFDTIECSCEWFCGYEKKDVPNWKELLQEQKTRLEKLLLI